MREEKKRSQKGMVSKKKKIAGAKGLKCYLLLPIPLWPQIPVDSLTPPPGVLWSSYISELTQLPKESPKKVAEIPTHARVRSSEADNVEGRGLSIRAPR